VGTFFHRSTDLAATARLVHAVDSLDPLVVDTYGQSTIGILHLMFIWAAGTCRIFKINFEKTAAAWSARNMFD
jgi:hypothetical protein